MENGGYVIAGWTLTGAALCAYALRLALRTRRASRILEREPASR